MPASTGVRQSTRELAGRRLLDLEIRGPRLVGMRRRQCTASRTSSTRRDVSDDAAHRRITSTPRPRMARPFRLSATDDEAQRKLRVGRRGQQHGVLGAHLLVRLLPGKRLLLGEPCGLHVGLDFLEGRYAAGNHGVDEYEMPAETGLDRPLPRARAEAWPPPERTAVRIPCRDNRARDRGSSPGT